jgi:hypothetical protein
MTGVHLLLLLLSGCHPYVAHLCWSILPHLFFFAGGFSSVRPVHCVAFVTATPGDDGAVAFSVSKVMLHMTDKAGKHYGLGGVHTGSLLAHY